MHGATCVLVAVENAGRGVRSAAALAELLKRLNAMSRSSS
jgi:hypothetical protein